MSKNPADHASPKASTESYTNWYDKENPDISDYIKKDLNHKLTGIIVKLNPIRLDIMYFSF